MPSRYAFLYGLALLGCTTVSRVNGPEGKEAILIKCTTTEDCYAQATAECSGPYKVVSTLARTGSIVHDPGTELLIQCGGSEPTHTAAATSLNPSHSAEADADSTSPPAVEAPKTEAPKATAGFSFGDTADVARAACESASFVWSGRAPRFACSGTPVDTGLGASARLTFCQGGVCRIELESPPDGDDGDKWMKRLTKTLDALKERYGEPAKHLVSYGPECRGPALPGCVRGNTAFFRYEWQWPGRHQIVLSLGAKPPEDEHKKPLPAATASSLRIRYTDGRQLDRSRDASVTETNPSDDEATTIGGL